MVRKYIKQFFSEEKSPEGDPLAHSDLLKHATKILKNWLKEFKSETKYLESEGHVLTKDESEKIINEYIKELGVEKLISLNFNKNQVAPTSIVHDTKKKKTKMNIRLPVEYRADRIMTMLHHEIGTHFIRRLNDK